MLDVFAKVIRILSVALLASMCAAEQINICYEIDDYPPFINSQNKDRPGFLVELVQLTATEAEFTINFTRLPWKRCIQMLQQGEMDALFAAIWLPERDNWGVFPKNTHGKVNVAQRLWIETYPIYVHEDSKLQWNGEQFTHVTNGISAQYGYVAYNRLEDMGVLAKGFFTPEKGLDMVVRGRLDAYIPVKETAEHWLKSHPSADQITSMDQLFLNEPVYVVFSNKFYAKFPGKVNRFYKTLTDIREQHGLDLLDRY